MAQTQSNDTGSMTVGKVLVPDQIAIEVDDVQFDMDRKEMVNMASMMPSKKRAARDYSSQNSAQKSAKDSYNSSTSMNSS